MPITTGWIWRETWRTCAGYLTKYSIVLFLLLLPLLVISQPVFEYIPLNYHENRQQIKFTHLAWRIQSNMRQR